MTLVTNFPHGIRAICVEDEKSEEEGTQNWGGLKLPTLQTFLVWGKIYISEPLYLRFK